MNGVIDWSLFVDVINLRLLNFSFIFFQRFVLILVSLGSHYTKMKFSIKDFFSKWDQIRRKTADLVTFIEEILNGKLFFVQLSLVIFTCLPKTIVTLFQCNI